MVQHLWSMREDHLAWVLITHCLHHPLLHTALSQLAQPFCLASPEQLQLTTLHPLHVWDDHNPRIGDAVIVPMIHRWQRPRSAEVDLKYENSISRFCFDIYYLRRVTEAKVGEQRLSNKLLEHFKELWTVLKVSDEGWAVVKSPKSSLGTPCWCHCSMLLSPDNASDNSKTFIWQKLEWSTPGKRWSFVVVDFWRSMWEVKCICS